MPAGSKPIGGGGPHYETSVVVNRHAPQLYSIIGRQMEDFVSLLVRQRGLGDFIAVLKKYDDDGRPVVAFGTGFDYVSALLGLEGSIAAGRWRPDEPWQPNGGK
jgi:hypothetical protein